MQVIRPPDNQASKPVTVVTGAARGIGFEVARLAAAAGRPLALLDLPGTGLDDAIAAVREAGAPAAVALACDVSSEDQVDAAFAEIAARLGPVRGLVASAGIDRGGLLHELPATAWDAVMGVNLRGAFLTCRAALGQMASGGGSIVCVSSPFALVGAPGGTSAYAASKGGVSALVRTLAVDYGAQGIRVNAVLPGPTETPLMWANVPEAERGSTRDVIREEVPLGRLADPVEPARTVLWLLSDDASYITGAQIACDGGVLAKASISV